MKLKHYDWVMTANGQIGWIHSVAPDGDVYVWFSRELEKNTNRWEKPSELQIIELTFKGYAE